ncbi:carbonic anhydrase [Actinoalloteichus spitiensis]|uniref:carbonic anhydrase n=1 Tax=Actinoalloteichus spitiensis TaxID=252394 RepID=UPI0004746313|nr:carbonic anhydrase [Actinoalloteichus spitiensis]
MSNSNSGLGLSRRGLFGLGGGVAAALAVGAVAASATTNTTEATTSRRPHAGRRPRTAEEAWATLRAGNERFARGALRHPHQNVERREDLADGQSPFATVLSCADSRVPPEIVFDQGLGDLFTVRSAGEVLDDAVIGSIEYAVEHLHTPLVLVLGHSRCGAVQAAVDLVHHGAELHDGISYLAHSIEAAVLRTPRSGSDAEYLRHCVEEQARSAARTLQERSAIVRHLVADSGVRVVSGVYDLDSGRVERL